MMAQYITGGDITVAVGKLHLTPAGKDLPGTMYSRNMIQWALMTRISIGDKLNTLLSARFSILRLRTLVAVGQRYQGSKTLL